MECIHMQNGEFLCATPESQGVYSAQITQLLEKIKELDANIHSLHIFKNGYLIAGGCAKPYEFREKRRIFSTAKSVTSLAVLFAVQEGLLNLDDQLIKYFPDKLPENISENLKKLTVRHTMMMSTGMRQDGLKRYHGSGGKTDIAQDFFATEIVDVPGTRFFYNNAVPEILGMLVKNVTGLNYVEYLQPRLLDKLDVEFKVFPTPQGWLDGSTTTSTTDALCKFTLFYLQQGMWNGEQLLDAELIRTATSYLKCTGGITKEEPIFSPKDEYGYGLQMWRNRFGGFRLTGVFDQIGIGVPEHNLAIVYTGMDNKDIDPFVEDILFKYMNAFPLDENPAEYEKMQKAFENWTSMPLGLEYQSEKEAMYQGKKFVFAPNMFGIEEVQFDFASKSLAVKQNGNEYNLLYGTNGDFGVGRYEGLTYMDNPDFKNWGADEKLVRAGAAWKDEKFYLELRFAGSMVSSYLTAEFNGDEVTLCIENTADRLFVFVSFGMEEMPPEMRPPFSKEEYIASHTLHGQA